MKLNKRLSNPSDQREQFDDTIKIKKVKIPIVLDKVLVDKYELELKGRSLKTFTETLLGYIISNEDLKKLIISRYLSKQ